MDDLNSHEIEMLEILAGTRQAENWGSWMTPVLEYLVEHGLVSHTVSGAINYEITDAGRAILAGRAA